MKKYKIILLLSIVPLFLSTSFLKKTNRVEDKWRSNISTNFRGTRSLSAYEVKLTYTGYATHAGPPGSDCPIRTNGTVVLTGLLEGDEHVDADDDIYYTGILQLDIDLDMCSIKDLPSGEARLCGMTVKFSGPVKTELEIYSDGQNNARGAWIKTNYDSTTLGKFNKKSVVGDCDHQQLVDEEDMVPNETKASAFNGIELPMLTDRTLRARRYPATGDLDGYVVDVLRKVK
jgi:hypothetical protein